MRPLLSDDAGNPEMKVISFPTAMESLGRGIDLSQNGNFYSESYANKCVFTMCDGLLFHLIFVLLPEQKHSFTFDKVFMPDASQEDVFVEISQLVQSALDGYKVMSCTCFH